jgi:peptide/nickel transport system ATP-binding protein
MPEVLEGMEVYPGNEPPVLSVKNLAVDYETRKGPVHAVRDVSFDIYPGQNLGLVGESGCGKSTVAFSVVNYLGRNGQITGGSILFKGQELRGRSAEELRRLRGADIAMVYQDPMSALNPTKRIGEQLTETLIAHSSLSQDEANARAVAALQNVNMPDPETVLTRYPHQISGGQQQRVLIAMAMLNNPALLVMDEPTTALDVTVEAAVLDLIAGLQARYRTATLYISHNLGVIARVSDNVAVMYAGQIVELAPVRGIFARPAHPYTVGLMRCLPDVDAPHGVRQLQPIRGQVSGRDRMLPGCVFSARCDMVGAQCTAEQPRLEEVAPGHLVRCHRRTEFLGAELGLTPRAAPVAAAAAAAAGQPAAGALLTAENVKTYYPLPYRSMREMLRQERRFVRAVDDVTFDMPRGATLGIVGESGCGKSTLARTIVGLEPLLGGQIEFMGADIAAPVNKRSAGVIQALQMVFQNPDGTLNPSYSVGDQIAMSLRRFNTVPKDQVYAETVRLLRAVKLDESYYRSLPRQLSGGEKQRVGIARALAGRPEAVICDEPVSALDVSVQAAILNLLQEIQQKQSTTMLLISHDLSTVRFFADYVAVMYLGRIVEFGPCEAIYAPPSHPYTAALLAAVPRADPDAPPSGLRLTGPVPSPVNPPSGCRFHTRCPVVAGEICRTAEPPARDAGNGHVIYCHHELDRLAKI